MPSYGVAGTVLSATSSLAILHRVHRDVIEILNTAATRDMLLAQGAEGAPGTPDDLARFIRNETAKWKKVIEVAGMRVE